MNFSRSVLCHFYNRKIIRKTLYYSIKKCCFSNLLLSYSRSVSDDAVNMDQDDADDYYVTIDDCPSDPEMSPSIAKEGATDAAPAVSSVQILTIQTLPGDSPSLSELIPSRSLVSLRNKTTGDHYGATVNCFLAS
jgi:hypothetical protein